jgi:glycosyltransferase involved in cell wall biosynthesis
LTVPGDRLRVLQIYPKSDFFTGAATQLWDLARGLKERGHEVIIATRPSPLWAAKCERLGIGHHAVPMASEIDLRSVARLARLLRAHPVDIVHAHKGKARTLALFAGLFVPLPPLVLNRGVSFPLDPFSRLGYTTKRVTAIVAVCQSIKRALIREGIPAGKIEVIYSGTDTERFRPGLDPSAIRGELGLGLDDFLVTQVGVRSWKGNDDVLEAMALVARQMPRARVLFVGASEAKARILREQAEACDILGRAAVLPYREPWRRF